MVGLAISESTVKNIASKITLIIIAQKNNFADPQSKCNYTNFVKYICYYIV
jgi:hypothetical protein